MDPITRAQVSEFAAANGLAELSESDQFEHFCAYSIVSARYSEDFDTSDLVVGGGHDLNVDSFAIKVNGRLANDAEFVDDILNMNGYLEVEFIVIQSKTSSSFDGAAIIALGDNLKNQVFSEIQTMPYNDDVKRFIEIKERIFSHAAKLRTNPSLRVFYACTGNWKGDTYLSAAIDQKISDLKSTSLFSEISYEPLGATQLQDLFRATRTSISREITFANAVTLPDIAGVDASYLGFLPHTEFLKLISDSDGEIIKSVFVDNVRDFQGENPVNTDIGRTISEGQIEQFVLRNNGVTIVSRDLKVTSNRFTLIDYQIVNGCQTSHVIHKNSQIIYEPLYVPVKLIHTRSEDVSQSVIKSTNRQTKVEEGDLLALTQFQRGLEDFYGAKTEDYQLHYERRAKQYAGRTDIERGRIVSISTQLKCFAAMFLEQPHLASRYQGTLMKSVGNQVFRENHRPEPYYLAALSLYRFEVAIRRLPLAERDIRPFRYYLLLAFRYFAETESFPGAGKASVSAYCAPMLEALKNHEVAKNAFDQSVAIVRQALAELGLRAERDSAKSRPLIEKVKEVAIENRPTP